MVRTKVLLVREKGAETEEEKRKREREKERKE